MKKIIVDKKIFDRYPQFQIGVVIAEDIRNDDRNSMIDFCLNESRNFVLKNMDSFNLKLWNQELDKHNIDRVGLFVDSQLHKPIRGSDLVQRNSVTDVCTSITLRHSLLCVPSDFDRIDGPLELLYKGGQGVYKDELGDIRKCLHYSFSDRIRVSKDTANALILVEILGESQIKQLERAMHHLKAMFTTSLGGVVTEYILNAKSTELRIG